MLYRLISNKPFSADEYNRRNKKFKRLISILIALISIFLWILNSYKFQNKINELYENGIESKGVIIKIEKDNLNSGNITSWNIFYDYYVEKIKYSGKLVSNEKPNLLAGDSIFIYYSRLRPYIHDSYFHEVNPEHIGFGQAMLKEWYIVAVGLIFISLIGFSKNEKK